MTLEQELELSYYQQVADIHAEHRIYLVQDTRTKKFYTKKLLTTYQADIYHHLWRYPVANTPRIIFLAEADHVLTVIEEYIPGDTLEERLAQQGTLSEDQVLNITRQLCTILSDFHHRKPPIVNRDIKPSNIIITPDGTVKLLDLNAAKWSNTDAPRDTVLLGTQGYAAPEQYGFGPSSVLSDLYSVGVLMNVMLCGVFPNQRIAPGQLGKVVRKCVQLSPATRYQSVDALLDALDELSDEVRSKPGRKSHWRKLLPPGFRSRKPVRHLFSALGYLLLFYCGLTLELELENPPVAELILNRIMFTAMCLSIVFFNGNYLGIQNSFILTKSKHRLLRWLGMAIVDAALISFWVILLSCCVSFFVG